MGNLPGSGARKWQFGQGLEPWPVTPMSYGDTPRPHSTGGCHGHSHRTASSPWSHGCRRETSKGKDFLRSHSPSGGGPGPAPSYPHLSVRGDIQGAHAPRSAPRARPGKRGHSPGTWSGNSWGSQHLSAPTLCQALRGLLARPPVLLGPCQNPKWRNWHQVHSTEKETEAQGAGACPGCRGRASMPARLSFPRAQAPHQHRHLCPPVTSAPPFIMTTLHPRAAQALPGEEGKTPHLHPGSPRAPCAGCSCPPRP